DTVLLNWPRARPSIVGAECHGTKDIELRTSLESGVHRALRIAPLERTSSRCAVTSASATEGTRSEPLLLWKEIVAPPAKVLGPREAALVNADHAVDHRRVVQGVTVRQRAFARVLNDSDRRL